MEIILVVILISSLLSFALQMTFYPKQWVAWLLLLMLGGAVYWAYPMAIEESYSSIQKNMSNPSLLADLSSLVIAEALFGCLLSIFQIHEMFGQRVKSFWRKAKYFGGLVFLISAYYLEVLLFINIRALDFEVLAVIFALLIPFLILLLKWFVKWLIPEEDLRTEMKFFLHLIQIICAIVLSVVVLKLPVPNNAQETEILSFIYILTGCLTVATVGYFYHNFKLNKKWK